MYVHYIATYITFLLVTEKIPITDGTSTSTTDNEDDESTVVVATVATVAPVTIITISVIVVVVLYFLWKRKNRDSHGMYMCSNYFHIRFYMHK